MSLGLIKRPPPTCKKLFDRSHILIEWAWYYVTRNVAPT